MATETALATTDAPASVPFPERIANFTGNHQAFLLWLLAHPSTPLTEGMKSLSLSEDTYYSWRRDIAGYAALADELRDYQHVLRQKLAQDVLQAATIDVARTMVVRAKRLGKDSRDAQRAGERILETVGVLRKDGDLPEGSESFDMIALRIRRNIAKP